MSIFTPLSDNYTVPVSLCPPLHHCQIIIWYQCHCVYLYTTVRQLYVTSVTVFTFTPLSDNYMLPVSLCPPLHHCQIIIWYQCHCIHHKPHTNLPGLFSNISMPKGQKQCLKKCRKRFQCKESVVEFLCNETTTHACNYSYKRNLSSID